MWSTRRRWLRSRGWVERVARGRESILPMAGAVHLGRWLRRAKRKYLSLLGRLRRGWATRQDPVLRAHHALLFTIEENPWPRETGTFIIYCCGALTVQTRNLNLSSSDPEPLLGLLRTHSAELRTCGHREVRFKNVSPWLKRQIMQEMRELQIRAGG
jgi:hypothetical protein